MRKKEMKNFIYVYSAAARDKLLASGCKLMKSDERNNIYIFLNEGKLSFASLDISYILSDTMTF